MTAAGTPAPPGALVQSISIGFRVIYTATALLALVWLGSNIRQVSPDSRAVVLRFGRIARVQEAGLLLAWPAPIEDVRLLPGADTSRSQPVAALPRSAGLDDIYTKALGQGQQGSAGSYLTGDGSVVLLDATLTYRIADPRAFFLAETHVAPALNRLFRAAAVPVIAGRNLDDLLVARPERTAGALGEAVDALRQAVRDDLLHGLNQRLADLAAGGDGLGVEVDRIDLTAWLPPSAKLAFDSVLTAGQQADQGIAAARTDAERNRQAAEQERTKLLDGAHATAAELVSHAHADTARVAALEGTIMPTTRAGLLDQAYRDQIATVLARVGAVTTVDGRGAARLILPGGRQP